MSSLKESLKGLTLRSRRKAEQKEVAFDKLAELYCDVISLENFSLIKKSGTLVNLDLQDLVIEDESLVPIEGKDDPTEAANFFKPWSVSEMEKHKKNPNSEEVKQDLPRVENTLRRILRREDINGRTREKMETGPWGRSMCYRLRWEVATAPRMGIEGYAGQPDAGTMKSHIKWRFHE